MKQAVIIAVVILAGCNAMPDYLADKPDIVINATHKIITPLGEASYVTLRPGLALSARHAKTELTVTLRKPQVHPTCDVAKFREPSGIVVELGSAPIGSTVYVSGYPNFPMPMAYNKGTISGYEIVNWRGYGECKYGFIEGAIALGMSGGGVWSREGKLVGIAVGWLKYLTTFTVPPKELYHNHVIFIPIDYIEDWINK